MDPAHVGFQFVPTLMAVVSLFAGVFSCGTLGRGDDDRGRRSRGRDSRSRSRDGSSSRRRSRNGDGARERSGRGGGGGESSSRSRKTGSSSKQTKAPPSKGDKKVRNGGCCERTDWNKRRWAALSSDFHWQERGNFIRRPQTGSRLPLFHTTCGGSNRAHQVPDPLLVFLPRPGVTGYDSRAVSAGSSCDCGRVEVDIRQMCAL